MISSALFVALDLPTPGGEYGSGGLVKRLTRVQVTDDFFGPLEAGFQPRPTRFGHTLHDPRIDRIHLLRPI